MENENKKLNIEIPESTIGIVKEARESYKRLAENIANIIPKLPKIDIPKLKLPEIKTFDKIELPPNQDIVREQDAWERHKEVLDVENAVLGIQTEILKEQKSTTKLTQIILFLTILGIIITVLFGLSK